LAGIIVGQRPLGEETLGLRGGSDQFGERTEADAAGKSRKPRLAALDEPLRGWLLQVAVHREGILERCAGTNLSAIE
jgi:hypothetical protein